MSETGGAKTEKVALASGAPPKPEGRVRERGRRPTCGSHGIRQSRSEAVRRLAIAHAADTPTGPMQVRSVEAA